jgi:hypothetical protein
MKLVVKIDLGAEKVTEEELKGKDWAAEGMPPGFIAIDSAYLLRDTKDDFFVFELAGIEE